MKIEEKLKKLFDDAIDISDTIWYSPTETLYDAILSLIEEEERWVFEDKAYICDDSTHNHNRYAAIY